MNIRLTKEQAKELVKEYLEKGNDDLFDHGMIQEIQYYAHKMEERGKYIIIFDKYGFTEKALDIAFDRAKNDVYIYIDKIYEDAKDRESFFRFWTSGWIDPFKESNKLLKELERKYELICRRN